MAWSTSNRRSELPRNWDALRKRVIRRDMGMCRGVLDEGALCGNPGTEVDHIRPGDDHTLGNLQLLCHTCHARKTHAESRAARAQAWIPTKAKGRPGTRSEPTPDVW
ncbi:HNH endonuclease [Streptomyces phage Shaeky]|uniref:HNH endonuclease n=1 Tax=Streptomyces phage Shaeky TaxID=2767586 RepID=A0A873WE52_9CAUD|nr:HNH endonuclease [Streptomyces phage Shaeky]